MKNETHGFTTLPLYTVPVVLDHCPHGVQVRNTLRALETVLDANRILDTQESVLVILPEQKLLADFTMLTISYVLRIPPFQRILLLVPPQRKTEVIEIWEQTLHWEGKPKEVFSMTSMPQHAQEAQVCIVTVADIQRHVEIDPMYPFFQTFDVLLLYDVPVHPGPIWHQIVELSISFDTCVIGLSSLLSSKDGACFFDRVLEMKKAEDGKRRPG
jgi:hypothetical protein